MNRQQPTFPALEQMRVLVLKAGSGECTTVRAAGGFPATLVVKTLPSDAGDERDVGLIPGLGRFSGGGHGNPVFLPREPMDRAA